jgi:uncharacterized protein YcbX
MSLHVEQLWRYPVKSLAGEALESADISNDGGAGDRLVRIRGPEGVRTSRRQYRLLGRGGTLAADGTPLVPPTAPLRSSARTFVGSARTL